VPLVEGLQFGYALHPLPPGRFGFGRWRWELWHGATLVAAGWRLRRVDAVRALRVHGSRFGHALFGLRPPDAETITGPDDHLPFAGVRVDTGVISFRLVPRQLFAGELPPGPAGLRIA
jgi:hypothetical protein